MNLLWTCKLFCYSKLLIFCLCIFKKICSTAKNGLVWCDVALWECIQQKCKLQPGSLHGLGQSSVCQQRFCPQDTKLCNIFWYISAQRQSTVFFHNIPYLNIMTFCKGSDESAPILLSGLQQKRPWLLQWLGNCGALYCSLHQHQHQPSVCSTATINTNGPTPERHSSRAGSMEHGAWCWPDCCIFVSGHIQLSLSS